jgi:hypothetical protein
VAIDAGLNAFFSAQRKTPQGASLGAFSLVSGGVGEIRTLDAGFAHILP